MHNPSADTKKSVEFEVAENAIFQIACAMSQIHWLRATLHVLGDALRREGHEHYADLATLAIYNADDWHNQLDCEREQLEEQLTERNKQEVRHA